MSCDSNANAISKLACRLSGGISPLAGKRGFYAGLALGGAGLVGAGMVALARRQSGSGRRPVVNGRPVSLRQIPQLPTRQSIWPLSRPSGERCDQCHAVGKPGLWYRINDRVYCQDCAPAAAQQADVDLAVPKPDVPAKPAGLRGTKSAGAISANGKTAQPLSPEKRVETRLEQSRMRVLVPRDKKDGGPVQAVIDGYVVLRTNGRDTGLAITPVMRITGTGELTENNNQWGVTHVSTGVTLADPYAGPQEAQMLAGILAQEDWTIPVEEMKPGQFKSVIETIKRFNQAVATAKGQPHIDRPLDGQLVTATMYGGVARVIQDNGSTLLLMDQMGGRHEVRRDEVRLPEPGDYESSRVAMAFDPAGETETTCPDCGISSWQTAGEMWYKAGWKARCANCTKSFAMNAGYFLEEEVGEEALA